MNEKIKIIYFDLDGVLADFTKGYTKLYGDITKHSKKELDNNKTKFHKDSFFLNLPVIQDGKSLLAMVEKLGYKPIILTAVGDNDTAQNAKDKISWVKKNLGTYQVLWVKKAREKAKYARPDALLIDDRAKSNIPFKKAGGEVIYYTGDTKKNIAEVLGYLT